MRKNLAWVIAFIIMLLLSIGVATTTSNYLSAILSSAKFTYARNTYAETGYELSTDMEHKTSATYLYDFSEHSPNRDLVIPTPQGPVVVTGRYGKCYRWAYPNNRAMNGTDLGIISQSFTIEAWLNPQPPEISDPTISWIGIPDEFTIRRLLIAQNGSAWAQMTDPLVNFYSNTTLPSGSWTHVAFVYDSEAGQTSWVINGTLDKTSEPGYTSSWNKEFKVGGWTERVVYRWNGKIDELRIKKLAMNPSQIAEDMNRPIQKIVRLTGLTPNSDEAILSLVGGGIPQQVTADGASNADFDAFDYPDFFEARFTVLRNGETIQSGPLSFYAGDEYRFSFTSYLSSNLIFIMIVIAFPLATAIAYVVRRHSQKRSS